MGGLGKGAPHTNWRYIERMASGAPKVATYEDVQSLPDNVVGELIQGLLVVSPRPAGPHAKAASVLGMDLGSPFQRGRGGPGGWIIIDEPELHLRPDVLVPDLAGWRRERMPEVPDVTGFELAPDWICEVLSPSTARVDRVQKMPIYLREGVNHVWLVDPRARTLEVYRRGEANWVLLQSYGNDALVRAEPFAEVELELSALWLSK